MHLSKILHPTRTTKGTLVLALCGWQLPMSGQALIDVFIDCNSAPGEVTENYSNDGYYRGIKFGLIRSQ